MVACSCAESKPTKDNIAQQARKPVKRALGAFEFYLKDVFAAARALRDSTINRVAFSKGWKKDQQARWLRLGEAEQEPYKLLALQDKHRSADERKSRKLSDNALLDDLVHSPPLEDEVTYTLPLADGAIEHDPHPDDQALVLHRRAPVCARSCGRCASAASGNACLAQWHPPPPAADGTASLWRGGPPGVLVDCSRREIPMPMAMEVYKGVLTKFASKEHAEKTFSGKHSVLAYDTGDFDKKQGKVPPCPPVCRRLHVKLLLAESNLLKCFTSFVSSKGKGDSKQVSQKNIFLRVLCESSVFPDVSFYGKVGHAQYRAGPLCAQQTFIEFEPCRVAGQEGKMFLRPLRQEPIQMLGDRNRNLDDFAREGAYQHLIEREVSSRLLAPFSDMRPEDLDDITVNFSVYSLETRMCFENRQLPMGAREVLSEHAYDTVGMRASGFVAGDFLGPAAHAAGLCIEDADFLSEWLEEAMDMDAEGEEEEAADLAQPDEETFEEADECDEDDAEEVPAPSATPTECRLFDAALLKHDLVEDGEFLRRRDTGRPAVRMTYHFMKDVPTMRVECCAHEKCFLILSTEHEWEQKTVAAVEFAAASFSTHAPDHVSMMEAIKVRFGIRPRTRRG